MDKQIKNILNKCSDWFRTGRGLLVVNTFYFSFVLISAYYLIAMKQEGILESRHDDELLH